MHHPGEVWFLPPEALECGDPKPRRHVLLTSCEDHDDNAVFAYATRSRTEMILGGACYLLNPGAHRYPFTGFEVPTYITPCRLVGAATADMIRMTGRIIDEMPAIRRQLHRALGIGTGTRHAGPASGGLRGSVVQIAPPLARAIGTAYGLLVTEARYSLQHRYQIFVPLLNAAEYESDELDVVAGRDDWTGPLPAALDTALASVRMIQTAFHPVEVTRILPVVATPELMDALDQKLLEFFGF